MVQEFAALKKKATDRLLPDLPSSVGKWQKASLVYEPRSGSTLTRQTKWTAVCVEMWKTIWSLLMARLIGKKLSLRRLAHIGTRKRQATTYVSMRRLRISRTFTLKFRPESRYLLRANNLES